MSKLPSWKELAARRGHPESRLHGREKHRRLAQQSPDLA